MVYCVEVASVLKHQDLIFQLVSHDRRLQTLGGDVHLGCLRGLVFGDVEDFAPRRELGVAEPRPDEAVGVFAQIRERRCRAGGDPACVRTGSEPVHFRGLWSGAALGLGGCWKRQRRLGAPDAVGTVEPLIAGLLVPPCPAREGEAAGMAKYPYSTRLWWKIS